MVRKKQANPGDKKPAKRWHPERKWISVGGGRVMFPHNCELVRRWEAVERLETHDRQPDPEFRAVQLAKGKVRELFQYVHDHPYPTPTVALLLESSVQPHAVQLHSAIATMAQWRGHMAQVWRSHPDLAAEVLEVLRNTEWCEFVGFSDMKAAGNPCPLSIADHGSVHSPDDASRQLKEETMGHSLRRRISFLLGEQSQLQKQPDDLLKVRGAARYVSSPARRT